jgi:hypothetical protein
MESLNPKGIKIAPLPLHLDAREKSEIAVSWPGVADVNSRHTPLNQDLCPFTLFSLRDFSPIDLTPHEIEALAALSRRNPEVWEPCMLEVLDLLVREVPGAANAVPVKRLLSILCPENEAAIRRLASASSGSGAEFLKSFNQTLCRLDMGFLPYASAMLCNMDSHTLSSLATTLRCKLPSVDAELRVSSRRMYSAGASEREVLVESILKGSFPVDFIVAEALCRLDRAASTKEGGGSSTSSILEKAREIGWEASTCAMWACAQIAAHAMVRVDAGDGNAERLSAIAESIVAAGRPVLARLCRVVVSGPEFRREALNLSRASALWQALVELAIPELIPSKYEAAKSMAARKVFSGQKITTQVQTIGHVFGTPQARLLVSNLVCRVLEVQVKNLKAKTASLRSTRTARMTEDEEEALEVKKAVAERLHKASAQQDRGGKDADLVDDDALSVFSGDTEVASDFE